MNIITHKGETYEFGTVEDLLETPRMRAVRVDPTVTNWAYDGFTIMAATLIDGQPVFYEVGRVTERVLLPNPMPKLTS